MKDRILLAVAKTLFVITTTILTIELVLIVQHVLEYGLN